MTNSDDEYERLALAREAEDLPLHIEMCAKRHKKTLDEISSLRAELAAFKTRLTGIRTAIWAAVVTFASMAGSVWATGAAIVRHLATM